MLPVVLVLLVQFLTRGDAQSEGGILDGMLKPLLKQINSFSQSHETKSNFHRTPSRQGKTKNKEKGINECKRMFILYSLFIY